MTILLLDQFNGFFLECLKLASAVSWRVFHNFTGGKGSFEKTNHYINI